MQAMGGLSAIPLGAVLEKPWQLCSVLNRRKCHETRERLALSQRSVLLSSTISPSISIGGVQH